MARLPRYNLTYKFSESGEILILDGDTVVDRFGRGNSPREDLPLMVWDDNDDTGARLISSPNDFGLRIYTLEGHEISMRSSPPLGEIRARLEFLNNTIAQVGPVTKAPRPKVVVTHAVVLRGVGEVFNQDLDVIHRIEDKIYSLLIGNTLRIPTLSQWGEEEDVWRFQPQVASSDRGRRFQPNGTEIHATLNDEDQGTKSHREWQTYIFKKYGALNPETL